MRSLIGGWGVSGGANRALAVAVIVGGGDAVVARVSVCVGLTIGTLQAVTSYTVGGAVGFIGSPS